MKSRATYVLGLDLGSASIGWAAINKQNQQLLAAGVRIFDPGVDSAEAFAKGQDESRAKARREARQSRRMTARRGRRLQSLFRTLADAGLLPAPDSDGIPPEVARDRTLAMLDESLRNSCPIATPRESHVMPYLLRARALDERLEPHHLGRALYHLAQRRGFLSNRLEKAKKKDEKEQGKVKTGILELEQLIKKSNVRTLGEYFSRLDPQQEREHIRRRWTARSMYEHEFETIWSAQQGHHPELLTGELKKRIHRAIFFQRPLRSVKHLIGACELEPKARRAPIASLLAQRFRVLQTINNLRVVTPDGNQPLIPTQRQEVLARLEDHGDLKFDALRKLLKLPKETKFNLESGGEKKLRGNRTRALMLSAFGEKWNQFPFPQQDRIVEEWRTIPSSEILKRRAAVWGLDASGADVLADSQPEDGYLGLSRKAVSKLLPSLENGLTYAEAVRQAKGQGRFPSSAPEQQDFLPPFRQAFPALRNPAVERALSELRKVINSIVRRMGRPEGIRIELARDLKRSKKERQKLTEGMREQEKRRDAAKARLLNECGIQGPSREDIEKVLLLEECGSVCPYTGRSIKIGDLFGGHSQFDIEHILPQSIFPDDSFSNKTLCHLEFNRNIKRKQTPLQALGAAAEFEQVIERVKRFKGGAAKEKLRRFQLDIEDAKALDDFTERRLQDTRYLSKLAASYLEVLYGGRDQDGTRKVFASSGTVTATLRRRWGLEAILREAAASANGQNPGKPRTDHRHHAIDAIVVALTSEAAVQQISAAAAAGQSFGSVRISSVQQPWPNFVDSIRPHVERMVVSHRQTHRLNGPLHNETNYGELEEQQKNTSKGYVARQPLISIKAAAVPKIVDDAVRTAVIAKIEALGNDMKKFQACVTPGESYDPPRLKTKNGNSIPILRVRVRQGMAQPPREIGRGHRRRLVATAGNHHIAFYEVKDKKGVKKWDAMIVPRIEAIERKRNGQPVIRTQMAETTGATFVFHYMGGDILEMDDNGTRNLFVVRTISETDLVFARHTDARKVSDLKETQVRIRSYDKFRALNPRKVQVSPIGEVFPAND